MKTSHFAFLLIMILTQISCKKDDDQLLPSVVEENYTVIDITFTVMPGSSVEEITEQRPGLEYANRTKLRQKILVDPGEIFEHSMFKNNSQQNYHIDNKEQLFSVPISIQDGKVSLGLPKWTYAVQEEKLPTQLEFKDSIYVEPSEKLTAKLSFTYMKMQASYSVRLKEKSSGKLVNMSGIWTGIYPLRKNFVYNTQDI